MKLYRGTYLRDVKGRQKVTSWTPSLPVAVIYSAVPPGGMFGSRDTAEFTEESTVHTATLREDAKVLDMCGEGNACTFSRVMRELEFGKPNGMTMEEGAKIVRSLHNRYMREVDWSGGPFKYIVFDEDQPDEPMDPDEVPFSIQHPQTLLSYEVLPEFDFFGSTWDVGARFVIETFALADVPTLRNVARRLGYEGLMYEDVFYGGRSAAPQLLGCEVGELEGVHEGEGIEDWDVPLHKTFRPLQKDVLVDRHATLTEEILPQVACAAPAANPRGPNPTPVSNGDLVRRLRF